MRMPWDKSKVGQLDLVDDANEALIEHLTVMLHPRIRA
jgi:hypothetical protein